MSVDKEQALNQQLERFEFLLHQWAGQWFPESRKAELKRAFARSLVKYNREDDPEGFLDLLEDNPSSRLKDNIVQEVLVGETYFFRDQALWSNLEHIILPDIISNRIESKNMRIWSAGCSTGEEPYSLALTLQNVVTAIDSWRISILATDISDASLNKARIGIYGPRSIRDIDDSRWNKWYVRAPRSIQMKEALKKLITFQHGNLSELNYPDLRTMGTDLILCRNVLIYFDRELVRKVITQFARCLSPNGWLILAPTEVPLDPPDSLRLQPLPHNFMALRPKTAQDSPYIKASLLSVFTSSSPNVKVASKQKKAPQAHVEAPKNTPSLAKKSLPAWKAPIVNTQPALTDSQFASSLTPITRASQLASQLSSSTDTIEIDSSFMPITRASQFASPLPSVTSAVEVTSSLTPSFSASPTASTATSTLSSTPTSSTASSTLSSTPISSTATSTLSSTPISSTATSTKPFDEVDYLAKYMQAKAEADRGQLHEALATANKCTRMAPTDARGWILLATIQEELRLYNKAFESLKRAIYLDNSFAVAHLFLARVQYRLGHPNTAASLKYFHKITENYAPDKLLPEGGGMTTNEARSLAERISQMCRSTQE